MTNDAIAFSKYLLAQGYKNLAFVDKNKTQVNTSCLSILLPEEIGCTEKKHVLLMAKTEKVCNEMMERLEELQVEGNVYTWRAFCIDTKKVPDGQTAFSLQQFIGSMPWIYYDIYGEKLCAEYSKKVYSPIQIVRMQKNLFLLEHPVLVQAEL